MFKMKALFTVIIIVIQLALTESHRKELDEIVSPVQFHNNPKLQTPNMSKLHRLRAKRESPCPLSTEKLLNVKNQINEVISQVSTQSMTCDFIETVTNNCMKWLKLLQCGSECLRNGLRQDTSRKAPIEQISKWEVVLKKLIYIYGQEGIVTKRHFSEQLQKKFDLLGEELQSVERVLNDLKRESINSKMKMCIESISNGNIENAVKYFKEIKKNSVLLDVTRAAYDDYGQLQNFKNILDFGSALSTRSQHVIVFATLYDLMKENHQLDNPYVVMFHESVKGCMKNTSIERTLNEKRQEIIDSWSNAIRNSDYNNIIQFLKGNSHVVITDYYTEIIGNAYAHNLKHARTILKFIRDIPHLEDQCICLNALYENMQNNDNLNSQENLMVAFRLKEIMEIKGFSLVKEYYKTLAVGLKNSFYPSVKKLIWNGDNCTIKSKHWNEYLYSPDNNQLYDSERRKVFTWRDSSPSKFIEAYWKFTPESNAEHFTIKTNINKEFLYGAFDKYDHDRERRRVFTWVSGTSGDLQGEWLIIPVNERGDFVIKNKYFKEYFYAAANDLAEDGERRRVFLWKNQNYQIASDIMWQIECDGN